MLEPLSYYAVGLDGYARTIATPSKASAADTVVEASSVVEAFAKVYLWEHVGEPCLFVTTREIDGRHVICWAHDRELQGSGLATPSIGGVCDAN